MDNRFDHFELLCGKAFAPGGSDAWIPVATVGLIRKGIVNVQFLIDQADPQNSKIVDDTVKELNFYLVELREPDPLAVFAIPLRNGLKCLWVGALVIHERNRQLCRASECLVLRL